jgi:tetratricopeptide (TPR) repeat protein
MVVTVLLALSLLPVGAGAQVLTHADPLAFDPLVQDGFTHFYRLDYDGAMERFRHVIQEHPQEPLAYALALQVAIFRELYHQDLLDTTYYAHNSFLTTKRQVDISDESRQDIERLTQNAETYSEQRIKADPQDKNALKNALFARGFARGLHAAFITLADHSYFTAAREGLSARNDCEAVLKIDPAYADAQMAVGLQLFAVASLPRLLRMAIGFAGVGGNKEKGLALLRIAAEKGVVTNIDSRTALSLFLRHDGRYAEAYEVQHRLAQEFPHNYLFRLEVANLAKDQGNGPLAISIYNEVIADARKPGYFTGARLQMAYFGLADTERGQNLVVSAAAHYVDSANQPNNSDWLRKRAELNAGEMFDLLQNRAAAVKQYQNAAAAGGDQSKADEARKYLRTPYNDVQHPLRWNQPR